MYIKNKSFVLTYRLSYLGMCGYGILRHFSVNNSIRNINMLSYFTIQSNILCFIMMFLSVIHVIKCIIKEEEIKYSRTHLFFRGMSFLAITITFFTYSIVLTQMGFSMDGANPGGLTINDVYVHYMIPILTWIDYLLFQPKPAFRNRDPFKWLWGPFIYFVFILVRGVYFSKGEVLVGVKRYPYFFMDAEKYGYRYVFSYALVFLAGCIVIGYIIYILDFVLGVINTQFVKIMEKRRKKKASNENISET